MARTAPGRVFRRGATLPVIAHLDVDCFYCQVEHRRLGIPRNEPLVVQQWESVVAVNYPARRLGIRRGDKCGPLLKKWPQLHAVHVDVLQVDEGERGVCLLERSDQEISGQSALESAVVSPAGSKKSSSSTGPYDDDRCLSKETVSSSVLKGEAKTPPPTTRKVTRGFARNPVSMDVSRLRETGKVSLARYRLVSNEILSILVEACPSGVERASVDEVYLDLTPQTSEILTSFFEKLAHATDKDSPSRVLLPRPSSSKYDHIGPLRKSNPAEVSSDHAHVRQEAAETACEREEETPQTSVKMDGSSGKAAGGSARVLPARQGRGIEPRSDLPSLDTQRRLLGEWIEKSGKKELSKKLREQLGKLMPELLDDATYADIAGVPVDSPRPETRQDIAAIGREAAPLCSGPSPPEPVSSAQGRGSKSVGVPVLSPGRKRGLVNNPTNRGRGTETELSTVAEDVSPSSHSNLLRPRNGGGYWPRECRFQAGYEDPPLHYSTLLEQFSLGQNGNLCQVPCSRGETHVMSGGEPPSGQHSEANEGEQHSDCGPRQGEGPGDDKSVRGGEQQLKNTREEKVSLSGEVGDILNSYLEAVWLLVGAVLLHRIRRLVAERAEFTMSGAVGRNKFLAKTASAQFKPDKQVIVPTCRIEALLAPLEFRSLKGMRGKRGQRVSEAFPDKPLVKDLLQIPIEAFRAKLGWEEAVYVYNMLRGDVDGGDTLKENVKVKSMLAFKSFPNGPAFPDGLSETKTGKGWGVFSRWLSGLCMELQRRTEQEYLSSRRAPKTLTVYFQTGPPHCQQYARSGPLCTGAVAGTAAPTLEQIKAATFQSLSRLSHDLGGRGLPSCSKIGLAVSGFVENEGSSVDTTPKITQFFSSVGGGSSKPTAVSEKPSSVGAPEPQWRHDSTRCAKGSAPSTAICRDASPGSEQASGEEHQSVVEDARGLTKSETKAEECQTGQTSGTFKRSFWHVADDTETKTSWSVPEESRHSPDSGSAAEGSAGVQARSLERETAQRGSLSFPTASSCSVDDQAETSDTVQLMRDVSPQRKRCRSRPASCLGGCLTSGSDCVVDQPNVVKAGSSGGQSPCEGRGASTEDDRHPAVPASFSLDVVHIDDSQEERSPTALMSRQLATISEEVPSEGPSETQSQSTRALLGVIASPPSTRTARMGQSFPEKKRSDSLGRDTVDRASGTVKEIIAVSDTDAGTGSESEDAEVEHMASEDLRPVGDLSNSAARHVTVRAQPGRRGRSASEVDRKSQGALAFRPPGREQITRGGTSSEKVLCNQCKSLVSLSRLQVHLDEHMAAFLFQEANPKCLASTASQALAHVGASQSYRSHERIRKQQDMLEEHSQLTLDGFLRKSASSSRKTVG